VFCPQGLGQVAEQCGLGFAETIFWGNGFRKTSTDWDFASGGGGVWGGILRLLHPLLLAKFGADTYALYCTLAIQCKFFYYTLMQSGKKLGENLRRLRLKKKLSQGDLAKALNVDRAYISNIENGRMNPTLSTLEKIAGALGISSSELLK
jgi:DNA-binding XRE family transcriptional regulator